MPNRTRQRDFLFSFLALTAFLLLYTLSIEYPDLRKIFLATMPMSIGLQGFCRLVVYFVDPTPVVELRTALKKLYEKNEKFEDQRKSMMKCCSKVEKGIKFMILTYALSICGPVIASLIDFIATGNTTAPVPIAVPFVDRDSALGFMVNFPLHLIMSAIAFFGFSSNDTAAFLFAAHEAVFVDVIKLNLSRITENLDAPKAENQKCGEKVKKLMKELSESHADLKAFHESLCKLTVKPYSAMVFFNTYAVCACGITLLTSDYYSAIGLAVSSIFQLLIVCGIGTFVCHQHKRLLDVLWEFDWYKLELADRKDFLSFLTFAQQPINLEPYIVGILDMELFIKVGLIKFQFFSSPFI